ncbi:hypothetical protein PHISCL_02252 [Aspergillus sclerotialis]|uniref:NADH-ubiquinone oxidoreductase n=1 Tax=Aspergillus sclerotialis TaxID=2070753 RepID=A0A3A2ZQJ6_9EURO|nr:hypothetical protein PHISCL_02252 [Aspergillus sclerotialis]
MGTFFGSYVIYRIYKSNTESGNESWISNLISKWTPSEKVFEQRNALHTVAVEKAAHDRHLFMAQSQRETVGIRSPEQLNASGPYNVPAGALADVSAVAAHYERENQLAEEARVASMKDGKVVSLYD